MEQYYIMEELYLIYILISFRKIIRNFENVFKIFFIFQFWVRDVENIKFIMEGLQYYLLMNIGRIGNKIADEENKKKSNTRMI
jgi:hypothetical protein